MEPKILYKNKNLLVVNKPAGIPVYSKKESLIKKIIRKFPEIKKVGKKPRYGLIHRLDKETSGLLLIARNNKALKFFQNQFKERKVVKKYLALVRGRIKGERTIKTLIGRDPKHRTKQKAYLPYSPQAKKKGLRKAITKIKPLKSFKNFTLIEAIPKTGRKHQIRVHLKFINHPIVGDKTYNFKNQVSFNNLRGQFLHSFYLKIEIINKKKKEFKIDLPRNLKRILEKLK